MGTDVELQLSVIDMLGEKEEEGEAMEVA